MPSSMPPAGAGLLPVAIFVLGVTLAAEADDGVLRFPCR